MNFSADKDQRASKPTRLALSKETLALASDSNSHILSGVDMDTNWELLQNSPCRELKPNYCLLEKHQRDRVMYIVLDGKLKAYLAVEQEQEIAQFETGQTVGELSVIDGAATSALVVAVETSIVLEIDEHTYWCLAEASKEFCKNMMVMLASRLRSNNYSLSENRRLQQKYQKESMVDGLTGIFNRRWLDEKLRSLVIRARRDHYPLSILILDIDHFKRFNDEFGHSAGDLVIQAVTKTFSGNVRPLDLSARFGGEEFCVLLPYTNIAGGKIAAERIRQLVADIAVTVEGQELPKITISAGVACLQPEESDTELIARADKALYRAKENGRNRVELA